MIRSFFQLSIRNLFHKNRLFTFINIFGLGVGLASLLLVTLFIYDEYNFDRHHKNAGRIYRIVLDFTSDGTVTNWAKTSAPIGQYLTGAYPEVEQVMRLRKNPGTDLLSYDEVQFYEERLFFADSTLFNVFDLELKSGNPSKPLVGKNSMIISDVLAKKYFKNEDPIGKTLRYNNQIDLTVTGIMNELPANSHFIADAFITFSSLDELLGEKRLTHWGQFDHYTYVVLTKGATPEQLELKFQDLLKKNAPEWVAEKETLFLQPLTSIHLHSDRKDEITPNSNESYSYILGTIAIFILLMACANFINLSTATQISRSKDIAIQKILGASRSHMTMYFLIESIVICMIALLTALILSYVALPYFNLTTGKQISLLSNGWLVVPSLILTFAIGILASIIPSLQAMQSSVIHVSKSDASVISKSTIRTALITFQFSISILLIIATLIVSSQLKFLKSFRLGFSSDQVVVIPVKDRSQNDRHSVLANEIGQLPGIKKASFSSSTPGSNNSHTYTYSFTGTGIEDRSMATFLLDENFIDLYEIKLKDGRLINIENRDTLSEVLLNSAAVKQLNLSQPIGQLITGKVKGRVVGIVENFNHTSLHSAIEPLIMYALSPTFRFVSVSLKGGEIQKGLASLEKRWPELYPGYPLEYFFLDDQMQQLYSAEFQLTRAYTSFSIIAMIIAGIGLIGLTTYLMARKLKEISIRKIFGSSTSQLIQRIYSGYVKIILISVLIAWSFGYYWMNLWLDNFAYKTNLSLIHFVFPALIMISILLLTTGVQTFKASRTNPIKNLREE